MIARFKDAWRALRAADAQFAADRALARVTYITPKIADSSSASKENEIMQQVNVTPTSNGYIIGVAGAPESAENLVVIETGGKSPGDLAAALGQAVVTLSKKEVAPK